MKKIFFFLAANLIAINIAFSQGAAINATGTAADNSSILDISASDKGLLIPRISLTGTSSASPVTGPLTSLLIYNQASVSDVIPGFYFWNNSNKWERIISGAGIAGHVPFWGNTNALTYDNNYFYYDGTNHRLCVGTATPAGARLTVKSSNSSYDGIYSEHSSTSKTQAFSAVSGTVNSPANYTTSQGFLGYHTTGNRTYGVYGLDGDYAGYFKGKTVVGGTSAPDTSISKSDLEVINNLSGNPANLTLRQSASQNTNGTVLCNLNFGDNHQYDAQARISVTRGAAGGSADLPTNIIFSTIPDGTTTLSERLRITHNGRIGINTNTPGSELDVKGTARISGSSSGYVGLTVPADAGTTTYTLPSADGADGEFLKTNGSGTLSWGSASAGSSHYIGENYGGGVVFFVTDNGQHGLIAPTSDQSTSMNWSDVATEIGPNAQSYTDGATNTTTIAAASSTGAAFLCDTTNFNGYSDWFLPSITQLNMMYNNWYVLGGTIYNRIYWSSTEVVDGSVGAYFNFFGNATQVNWGRTSFNIYVRCIRSF